MNTRRPTSILSTFALIALASATVYSLIISSLVFRRHDLSWQHWLARDGDPNQVMRVVTFVLLPLSALGLGLTLTIRAVNPKRQFSPLLVLALLALAPAASHYLIVLTRIIAHQEVLWLHWMADNGYMNRVMRGLLFMLLPLAASVLGLALTIRTRSLFPGLATVVLGLLVFALWASFNAYSYWLSIGR
jgi:hypothetical protein